MNDHETPPPDPPGPGRPVGPPPMTGECWGCGAQTTVRWADDELLCQHCIYSPVLDHLTREYLDSE